MKDEPKVLESGCPAPEMPVEFFEQYPGARWDHADCIWRDGGGNPIGGGRPDGNPIGGGTPEGDG
jgi:hypothetical protein